jgi:putative glutamine amidotransferase
MLDLPERDTHLPRFSMNRTFFDPIRREGGVPVALVPGCSAEMALYVGSREGGPGPKRPPLALDGICLSGGGDLDPSYWGSERRPLCGPPDPERDEMEMTLLSLVRGSQIPVLAICRGIQVLNAAWGGTVIQDIADERPRAAEHFFIGDYPRDHLAHEIRIEPGSHLHGILGVPSLRVNSLHHQAVDELGEGLVATAWSPDGIIEGIELAAPRRERFLIGIQCHPEDLQDDEPMRRIFTAFVDAARIYKRSQES